MSSSHSSSHSSSGRLIRFNDENLNPIKRSKCPSCLIKDKRFTIFPPYRWHKTLTWFYPGYIVKTIRTLLMIRQRPGTLFSVLPKDLFFYLIEFVARCYLQSAPSLFFSSCDDCIYYRYEIDRNAMLGIEKIFSRIK